MAASTCMKAAKAKLSPEAAARLDELFAQEKAKRVPTQQAARNAASMLYTERTQAMRDAGAIRLQPKDSPFADITERVTRATNELELNKLADRKEALAVAIRDAETAMKGLKTRGGAITEDKQPAADRLTQHIGTLRDELAAVETQTKELRKTLGREGPKRGRPAKGAEPSLATLSDEVPAAQQFEEVESAIEAFEKSRGDNKSEARRRREDAVGFLIDVANGNMEYGPEAVRAAREWLHKGVNVKEVSVPHTGQKPSLPRTKLTLKAKPDAATLVQNMEVDEGNHVLSKQLRGATFMEALQFAVDNAASPDTKYILKLVSARAKQLEKMGFKFAFEQLPPGFVIPSGARGRTTSVFSPVGEHSEVSIRLNGYVPDSPYSLYETMAHEFVHAVTEAQIKFAPNGAAAKRLKALHTKVGAAYNKAAEDGTLEGIAKDFYDRKNNALDNPSELLAWGLTNRKMQQWLSTIEIEGASALRRLYEFVASVLGIDAKRTNALSELMDVSTDMLSEDLEAYVAEANANNKSFGFQPNTTKFPSWAMGADAPPVWVQGDLALLKGESMFGKTIYLPAKNTEEGIKYITMDADRADYNKFALFTPQEVATLRNARAQVESSTQTNEARGNTVEEPQGPAQPIDLVRDREDPSFREAITRELGSDKSIGLRVKFTDSLAAVDALMTPMYKGKVRDAEGSINPMVLMSRALDSSRFSEAVQMFGGLARKADLWVADTLTVPEGAKGFEAVAGEEVSYLKALKEIVASAKAKGVTQAEEMKRLGNLMVGRRYHELHQQKAAGQNDFDLDAVSPEDAAQAAADFAADPLAVRVQQMMDYVRFNLIDAMQQSGRISAEQALSWKDATGYVPFDRIKDAAFEAAISDRQGNRGLAALRNLKPFKGSDDKVVNPIEPFSRLTDWMVNETFKNEAAAKALREMEMMGTGAAKRVPAPEAAPNSKMVVTVRENGRPAHYYVPDPAMFVAFSHTPPAVSSIVKGMQKASQILRAGVTSAPPFVVKQIFDDIHRIYAYTELKHPTRAAVRILSDLPAAWFNEAFRRHPKQAEEMRRVGVMGSFDFTEQGNTRNIMREAGVEGRTLGQRIMHFMEAGAKAQDLVVRRAIYDQILKESNDPAYAESQAREVINFSRRGAAKHMDTAIRLVPFFNAYARGMDKLLVAATGGAAGQVTGQARAKFYQRMLQLTAMGTMYALMMQDDEDYLQLDDHVRDRNWVLPYGKELGFTPVIPVPEELAFAFKAIPERVIQYMRLHGTPEERDALTMAGELAKQGAGMLMTPNLSPQALRWLVENLTNHSFFLNRPLESQSQIANYKPFARYGMETSETVKSVAAGLESAGIPTVSPIMIENALRGLFGTTAGIALGFTDMLFHPTRTDRPMHQQLSSVLTGASALMKDPIGAKYIGHAYEVSEKATQVHNTFKKLAEQDADKAKAFIEDNIGLYSIYEPARQLVDSMRELSKAARMLDNMENMSADAPGYIAPDKRRDMMNYIKNEQQKIAKNAYILERQARAIQAQGLPQ